MGLTQRLFGQHSRPHGPPCLAPCMERAGLLAVLCGLGYLVLLAYALGLECWRSAWHQYRWPSSVILVGSSSSCTAAVSRSVLCATICVSRLFCCFICSVSACSASTKASAESLSGFLESAFNPFSPALAGWAGAFQHSPATSRMMATG